MSNYPEKALELKEQGNECVKAENYSEAILHYSHAIKLDPNSPQLCSNRSLAFLKLQSYCLALQDAKDTVNLNPAWVKGYFRQAEVEFATENFSEALLSYQKAYQIQPESSIFECIVKCGTELQKQKEFDKKTPWISAGVGLVLGVFLVLIDATLPKSSVFQHPIIQVIVSISLSLAGLGIGMSIKWYTISRRKSWLEPPVDLLGDNNNEEEKNEQEKKVHKRYTKAQARQRYRKGKL